MPAKSSDKILLAMGKVSGSFEVWICDISCSKFDKVGSYEMHDHVVSFLLLISFSFPLSEFAIDLCV